MDEDVSKAYSPSRLETYRNCPRQYKFRYLDRLPRRTRSVEAFLGSCAHAALEALYEGISHGKTLSEEEVLARYEDAWERGLAQEPPVALRDDRYSLEDFKNAGRDCARGYYRAHRPFDEDRTIAVERRLGFPLTLRDSGLGTSEEVRIEGYIDRLALDPDGAFVVHDYKTGRTLPTQERLDREDWQLAIYELAVRHAWPDARAVRLRWHYLRHGKALESSRSAEDLSRLRGRIAELIGTIKRDRAFEPVKSPLCDWCDYRSLCPLWSHEEAVARMSEEERRDDDGVRLVDRYAQLERRKKRLREETAALEAEQDELARRAIEYALERGLSAVSGTDGVLDIHEKEEFRFPTRAHAPEKLEAIESALKRTPVWPRVSRLEPRALMEGFKKGFWPEEVRLLIEGWMEKLIRRETARSARLRPRRPSEEE